MEKHEDTIAVFDYTLFLGESCKQKWTFIDGLYSSVSVFCRVWKGKANQQCEPNDKLWKLALNNLSASSSDESNIISLVNVARHEGIKELHLMLPYELDIQQINTIIEQTNVKVWHVKKDQLIVIF
ncbi:transporter [Vibrio sp. MA40-2]|uniref:transporter n=1 Tax=Vibrio sp. MA40-2 TaxID=3391828 RepID=UPI0039A66D9A